MNAAECLSPDSELVPGQISLQSPLVIDLHPVVAFVRIDEASRPHMILRAQARSVKDTAF